MPGRGRPTDTVALVDQAGNDVGDSDKMEAHRKGLIHRAVSVFLFDSSGRLLLQRRAQGKYHSGGLWANTCCTHPYPKETAVLTAHRRLKEEMGISCKLKEIFAFTYRAKVDNGLTEHERDHVFIGRHDGDPTPDKSEVQDWKWMPAEEVLVDMETCPEAYAYWFKACAKRVIQHMEGTTD